VLAFGVKDRIHSDRRNEVIRRIHKA
jgi:hypothetical protein